MFKMIGVLLWSSLVFGVAGSAQAHTTLVILFSMFKKATSYHLILSVLGILILGTLGLSQNVWAGPIQIFSTGVNNSGTPLSLGAVDPHFVVAETGNRAVVLNPACDCWLANDATSQWVWLTSDYSQNINATWTFRTTFDLAGFDPSTARIDGLVAVDNGLNGIKLNGHSVPSPSAIFSSFSAFSITSGFQSGINTLEFIAVDIGIIAGFNVQLSGTADYADEVPTSTANYDTSGTPDDPVNPYTGELFQRYSPEINLGGPMPLYFARYYASSLLKADISGSLVDNWRHHFEWTLTNTSSAFSIVNPNGRLIHLTQKRLRLGSDRQD